MREINVGPASTFADPGRKLIESDGVEVGVFKLGGEFFAYENVCPHMGGPACQGKIIAKVEEVIADDRTSKGVQFSIRPGRHHGTPRYRLKPIKVRLEGVDVIVTLPDVKKSQNVTVQPTADGRATRPEF